MGIVKSTKSQMADEIEKLKLENDLLKSKLAEINKSAQAASEGSFNRYSTEHNPARPQEYLKAVLNSVNAAVFIIDAVTGKIIDVNQRMCEMFGYDYEDAINIPVEKISAGKVPYDQRSVDQWHEKARRLGPQNIEWLAKHKSGHLFWIEVNIKFVSIQNEERFVVTVNDISARKEAERALLESESNYRGLFNSVAEAIYILDFEFKFLDVNYGAEIMYGCPKSELIGKTPEFVSAPGRNDMTLVLQYLQKAMAGEPQQFEFWGRRPYDDSVFPKDVRVQKGRYSAEDVLIAIAIDITERKRIEFSLRESEEKHRLLLDESSDPIFSFEPDGTYKYVNNAFAAPFNKRPEEIIGKRIYDIFPKDEADKRFSVMRWVFEHGETRVFEVRVPVPTGDRFYLTSVKPIKNAENSVLTVICSSKEITELKRIEKDLRESREQFIQFMKYLPGLAYIKDSERRILFVNDKFTQDFDIQLSDWINKRNEDFWPGEVGDRIKHDDEIVLNTGQVITAEEKIMTKRGRRTYLTTKFPIPVSENESMLGGITIDLSERKKLDDITSARLMLSKFSTNHSITEILKKTLNELLAVMECDAVVLDLLEDDMKTVIKSIRADGQAELSAYSRAELAAWNRCVFQQKTILINSTDSDAICFELPGGHNSVLNELFIPVLRDGNVKAVLSLTNRVSPFINEDAELAQLLIDSVWDLVKRKQALADLELSERRYRKIIENIQDVYYRTDNYGIITIASTSAVRMLGFSSLDEIIGAPITNWWAAPDERAQMLKKIQLEGAVIDYEVNLRRKNGEIFTVAVSSAFYTDENGVILGVEGVFRDITIRKMYENQLIKAKEEAEEMNRAKSSFLANMSHELRTPLIGIIGYSDILRELLTEPKHKQMMETIFNSGGRLLETLNLILNLAKIEANQQDIQWQVIDLRLLIKQSVKLYEAVAAGKKLQLIANLPDADVFVNADLRLLSSAVNNLVNNAIKFTENGCVSVELEITTAPEGEFAVIRVIDTGIGISDDDKAIIFEEFRQVSEGYGRAFEGSGLGLAIVKRSIEILGGSVLVHSNPGSGSVFSIRLPIQRNLSVPPADKTVNSASINVNHTLPDILLIDDDEATFGVVSAMLESFAGVHYARNGSTGVEMMKQEKYAAVLLDINLGRGIDGLAVLKLLRLLPEYDSVPVIALTAYAMDGDRERFLSAGCDLYLSKPFLKNELISKLNYALCEK